MHSVCLSSSLLKKTAGVLTFFGVSLTLATSAFAQTASTSSAGKGGTSSSLPSAGSTDITYLIFGAGILLFVYGMIRLIQSYGE